MKRSYFVRYFSDFRNNYNLFWVESGSKAEKLAEKRAERITRDKAIELCIEERNRRKFEPSTGWFSSAYIDPYGVDLPKFYLCQSHKHLDKSGYIVLE